MITDVIILQEDMLKMIIADDEMRICALISGLLDWDSLGIEISEKCLMQDILSKNTEFCDMPAEWLKDSYNLSFLAYWRVCLQRFSVKISFQWEHMAYLKTNQRNLRIW